MNPWPDGLPPLAPAPPLGAPDVFRAVLSNGLAVWALRRTSMPLVAFRLTVLGGRAYDPSGLPGLAGLVAAGLKDGTARHTGAELSERLQAAGAELGTAAGDDALDVTVHGLVARVEALVEVLAEVVTEPAFRAHEVARLKALALEELATNESEPEFLAERAFRRAIYGSHPYAAISPTEASIEAVTPDLLRADAPRRLVPERALLVAVGDVEPGRIVELAERFLGGWRADPAPLPEPGPAASLPGPLEIHVLPRAGSVQTHLVAGQIGVARRDPDADALGLLVTIYGGAFSSRLVSNLREEKGYTYSPRATLRFARHGGTVRTWAAVRNEVTGAALNEILYEMGRLATHDVSSEELARCAGRDLGLCALRRETSASLAAELSTLWLHGLGPEEMARQAEALSSLVPSDLRRAARRSLGTGSARIVAVGDIGAIREELFSFGPLRVLEE